MLSQQSSRGVPPSEIETSPLYRYRVPNLRFFKYPNNLNKVGTSKREKVDFEKEKGRPSCNQKIALTSKKGPLTIDRALALY